MLNSKDKFPEGILAGPQTLVYRVPCLTVDHIFEAGSFVWDIERGKASGTRRHYYQTDTSVSASSWGFVEGKTDYKSAR